MCKQKEYNFFSSVCVWGVCSPYSLPSCIYHLLGFFVLWPFFSCCCCCVICLFAKQTNAMHTTRNMRLNEPQIQENSWVPKKTNFTCGECCTHMQKAFAFYATYNLLLHALQKACLFFMLLVHCLVCSLFFFFYFLVVAYWHSLFCKLLTCHTGRCQYNLNNFSFAINIKHFDVEINKWASEWVSE